MWVVKSFDELTNRELYDIYKLRSDVFIVEQQCAYPEVDEYDLSAIHVMNYQDNQLSAYCRLIETLNQVKLGRVVVNAAFRKKGLGRALVSKGIEELQERYSNKPIFAQAQAYLFDFYSSFGFKQASNEYIEDGIAHIDMVIQ